MSLFQFGVRRASAASRDQPSQDHSESFPTHMPNLEESGLGRVEFEHSLKSGVGSLADPAEAATKKRKARGKYVRYTTEQRASVGKYALENGNERARRHFSSVFPNISEVLLEILRRPTQKSCNKRESNHIRSQLSRFQLNLEGGHHFC